MRCTKCREKDVGVTQPVEERPTVKVVATDRGVSRVYHRPGCHFAIKINLEDLIEFQSDVEAERQAYVACGFCF
jgi:lipoate-protein ligase B